MVQFPTAPPRTRERGAPLRRTPFTDFTDLADLARPYPARSSQGRTRFRRPYLSPGSARLQGAEPEGGPQLGICSGSRSAGRSSAGAMLADRRLEITTTLTTMPTATRLAPIRSPGLSA